MRIQLRNVILERYLKVVDQGGISATVSLWGKNYAEGNIGYLKSVAYGDRVGGTGARPGAGRRGQDVPDAGSVVGMDPVREPCPAPGRQFVAQEAPLPMVTG